MQVHVFRRRGEAHPLYCEDFLYVHTTEQFIYGAVFDGCSSGKDAHFSSALFGKCLKKVITFHALPQLGKEITLEQHTYAILDIFFSNLLYLISALKLSWEELLSTLLFTVYSVETDEAVVIAFGDGVLAVNDRLIIIDQENSPNYPVLNLNDYHTGKFEDWIHRIAHVEKVKQPFNLALATDGILSFWDGTRWQENVKKDEQGRFLIYQAADETLPKKMAAELMTGNNYELFKKETEARLERKDLVHYDDLSLIRLKK